MVQQAVDVHLYKYTDMSSQLIENLFVSDFLHFGISSIYRYGTFLMTRAFTLCVALLGATIIAGTVIRIFTRNGPLEDNTQGATDNDKHTVRLRLSKNIPHKIDKWSQTAATNQKGTLHHCVFEFSCIKPDIK